MTYQTGSLIVTDINGFLTAAYRVYGVGSGDHGYGQTGIVQSPVNAGDTIRAIEWSNLHDLILVCANQQGSNVTSLPPSGAFVPGQLVFAHEQDPPSSNTYELTSNLAVIDTSRLLASGSSLSVATNVSTVIQSSIWAGNITAEVSVLWGSEDAARYYFNAAGQIRLHGSHPTGGSNDNLWNSEFASGLGTLSFTAHQTSNTGNLDGGNFNGGFYEMTDVYQTIWTDSSTAGVSLVILAKRLHFGGVNGGNGTGVQFNVALTETAGFTTTNLAAGTSISFDNVRATTFLTGIAAPTYSTVTAFAGTAAPTPTPTPTPTPAPTPTPTPTPTPPVILFFQTDINGGDQALCGVNLTPTPTPTPPAINLFRTDVNGTDQALGGLP